MSEPYPDTQKPKPPDPPLLAQLSQGFAITMFTEFLVWYDPGRFDPGDTGQIAQAKEVATKYVSERNPDGMP